MTMQELIGRRVRLAGLFAGAVLLEDAESLEGGAFKLRVRTAAGQLDETFVTEGDVLAGVVEPVDERSELVAGADLFDFVEARRIVTQALQGRALRDGDESKPVEAQACERLLGAWRSYTDLRGAIRHLLTTCAFQPPAQETLL
jgi:hypothetical protein